MPPIGPQRIALQRIVRKIRHSARCDGSASGACTVQPLWPGIGDPDLP
jgi:hypothetical protein